MRKNTTGYSSLRSAVCVITLVPLLVSIGTLVNAGTASSENPTSPRSKPNDTIKSKDEPFYLDTSAFTENLRAGQRPLSYEGMAQEIQAHPKSAIPYIHRAMTLLAEGEIKGAMSDLDKALSLEPKSALVHIALSRADKVLGKWKEVHIELEKAVELGPPEVAFKALYESAFLHKENLQYAVSLAQFSRLLSLNRDPARRPVLIYFRGELYHHLGKLELALKDYDTALKSMPNFALAHLMKGNALYQIGKYADAITESSYVIDLDQKYGTDSKFSPDEHLVTCAYRQRAEINEHIGRKNLANCDLKAALEHEKSTFGDAPFRMH